MRGVARPAIEIGHRDRLSRRARGLARIGASRSRHGWPTPPARRPRRRRAPQRDLRARRRRAHADVHPPAAAGARVRRPGRGPYPHRHGPLDALRRRLQPHRPAGRRRCPPGSPATASRSASSSSARPTPRRGWSRSRPSSSGARAGPRTVRRWRRDHRRAARAGRGGRPRGGRAPARRVRRAGAADHRQEHADRPGQRGRPRRRAPDPRADRAPPGPTTASWGRRAATAWARAACAGSSIRSTAR